MLKPGVDIYWAITGCSGFPGTDMSTSSYYKQSHSLFTHSLWPSNE